MDIYPSKRQNLELHLMKSEQEVVNRILDHHGIDQAYVTKVQVDLFQLFDGEKGGSDLRSIKDNLERIRVFKGQYLDKLERALDKELFGTRQWIDLLSKNEALADLFRKRGNEYFVKKNFDMALRAYTLAGMYAPRGSKSLALSYSNRSACFAETKNWRKCLEDIKRFEDIWSKIEKGFSLIAEKVAKRKEICLKEIGNKEGISLEKEFGNTFFKLKNPSADLPSLEDFLGVKTDAKKGRGIYNISDKAIEPGTLLILDNAYSHVSNASFDNQTKNCSACYRILDGSGIPCGKCVFNLYCSEACATSDYHDIHARYECKMGPYLFEIIPKTEFYSNVHLALSILLKLGSQALLDHYLQVFNNEESQRNDKEGSAIASYLPIYNLIYHDELLSEGEILEHCKFAVILIEVLDFSTDYFTCLNLDELEANLIKEEFAKRLLLHQMCINANGNTTGYLDLPRRTPATPEEKGSDLSFGIYPVTSLMNHSCAPNANWLSLPGGVFAVFALEHIVPGQELLVNYRGHYSTDVRESRRQDLWRHYGFKCECTACTDNWPLMVDLKLAANQRPFPFICPDCRMKFEVFDKIRLNPEPSQNNLVCSRNCGFKVGRDEIQKTFVTFLKLTSSTLKCEDVSKVLKTLMDAKKCVLYFDAHLAKPCREIQAIDEVMQEALQIIARKMFE